jgi:hypothetical protein
MLKIKRQRLEICLFLAFALLVTACGDDSDDDTPTQSPPQKVFQAALVGGDQPNQYQVHLSWFEDASPRTWTIRRNDSDLNKIELASVSGAAKDYLDSKTEAGKKYIYFLGTGTGNDFQVIEQTDITIPMDLQVGASTELQNVVALGRLFLEKDSKIVTHGVSLNLTVNEIISKGGIIESFDASDSAPDQSDGRPGGDISIRAQRGQGNLTIFARGERGGTGPHGTIGTTGSVGGAGR